MEGSGCGLICDAVAAFDWK